jgi:hypothetical protein
MSVLLAVKNRSAANSICAVSGSDSGVDDE